MHRGDVLHEQPGQDDPRIGGTYCTSNLNSAVENAVRARDPGRWPWQIGTVDNGVLHGKPYHT